LESSEFERAVVASILIAPDEAFACPNLALLRPEHFRDNVFRHVFKTALAMQAKGQHISMESVYASANGDGPTFAEYGVIGTFFTGSLDLPAQAERVRKDGEARTGKTALQRAYKQLDEGYDPSDVLSALGEAGASVGAPGGTLTLADQEKSMKETTWVWDGWLPRGFVTLIVGDVEIGKSLFTLNIVHSMLVGTPWPDGRSRTPAGGRVVWYDTEAAEVMTIARATRLGTPKERIIAPTVDGMTDISLWDDAGRASFEGACRQDDIDVVVVDSLGGAHTHESDDDVKVIVRLLANLARDRNIPVLLIHHPRKLHIGEVEGEITLDRIRGFSGITQFARLIWAVEKPDKFSEMRRVRVIKSNLASKPEPVGFEITKDGLLAFTKDAPERIEAGPQLVEAEKFIRTYLGPPNFRCQAAAILTGAQSAGISERTLMRAKKALGVGSEKNARGEWDWVLPT